MASYVILITVPNEETAKKLSNLLVQEGLAKCVNIVSDVKSVFSWKGKTEEENELLLIAKGIKNRFADLIKLVKENHPYEVPEIIALPIIEGSEEYMKWLES